ncbi:hypothetical protein [uncultured Parasphingorhabdus sp.]|uniref:hypothetical protein n=1 Tax=uncultured Parasphingorhabdus sp. TaxID=2709694 RepID=UPI0030DB9C6C|tara:strand:+ start:18209 stop:18784 length:576 start_codon:yes stop_codon:yes gene_type:complete
MKICNSRISRLFGGLSAGVLLAMASAPASAQDNPERQWSHKDWHAEYRDGRCAISTGGDGSGWFRIELEKGGLNSSASYLPIVYSSEPLPLREDDKFALIIDNSLVGVGEEMSYYDGPDAYGRFMVGASLPGGFVPDLITKMRKGDNLSVRVEHSGEVNVIVDDFSLSGFTATYLKIAHWCDFDPDNLFRS